MSFQIVATWSRNVHRPWPRLSWPRHRHSYRHCRCRRRTANAGSAYATLAAAYADSGDDAAMDECQPRSQPCISSEASHLLRFRFVAERARHGQATPRGCEQPAGIIAACGQAQAPRGDCDGRAKHSPGRRSTLVGPLLAPKHLADFEDLCPRSMLASL